MKNDPFVGSYRSLLRARVDLKEYFIAHYVLQAEESYTLAGAALRTLLILTRRTLSPPDDDGEIVPERYGAVITSSALEGRSGPVSFAFPVGLLNADDPILSFYQIATSAAEYSYCKDVWLADIDVPDSVAKRSRGPRHGVAGLREIINVKHRPLVAPVMSRVMSSTESTFRSAFEEVLVGGADLIVDDILDTPSIRVAEMRVSVASDSIEAYRAKAPFDRRKPGYVLNCIGSSKVSQRLVKLAKRSGVFGVITNGFVASPWSIQDVRLQRSNQLAIFCTNMGSSMLGRNPAEEKDTELSPSDLASRTGVSEMVTAKISRMLGADAVHTGTAGAECWHPAHTNTTPIAISERVNNLRASMSIAEGNIALAELLTNTQYLGRDTIFEVSSGIFDGPGSISEGVAAYRLLCDFIDVRMSEAEFEKGIVLLRSKNRGLDVTLKHQGWQPVLIEPTSTKSDLLSDLREARWMTDEKMRLIR